MLQLRGRGQHDVGVIGGVGHEVFEHHGEQVFARKAAHHLGRFGRHGHRVAVVDHQRLDGRAARQRFGIAEQRVANAHHVDGARRAAGQQIGPLQRRAIHRKRARTAQQDATRALPPGAGERRQAGHRPHRVAAAGAALHAVVEANGGGFRRAIGACQITHLLHGDAANRRHPLRIPEQRALAQRRPSERVTFEVIVIQPIVGDQLMHHAQCQRGVGAGQQGDVLVALVGGFSAARIDADEARAIALGLLRQAPEMQVAGNRVAAPDQDQLGLGKELNLHAHLAAQRARERLAAGCGANGAVEQAGAQGVKKAPIHRFALHQAHGAGVAVGQDGLRLARGNGAQPRGDLIQRRAPRDRLEAPLALGAHAAQRRQDALGVVRALGVARHFGTQHAVGRRVRRVAAHAHGAAVVHRGDQAAGVGAVVRAGADDLAHRRRDAFGHEPTQRRDITRGAPQKRV